MVQQTYNESTVFDSYILSCFIAGICIAYYIVRTLYTVLRISELYSLHCVF